MIMCADTLLWEMPTEFDSYKIVMKISSSSRGCNAIEILKNIRTWLKYYLYLRHYLDIKM